MKSMRELINLMEGVMAVPGLDEKSTSEKQARFMAVASHDPDFAKRVGIDQSVAKEFNRADTGTKQLSNAMKHKDESCSMEENMFDGEHPLAHQIGTHPEDDVASNMKKEWDDEGAAVFNQEIVDNALNLFKTLTDNFVEPEEALKIVMAKAEENSVEEDELYCIRDEIMRNYGVSDDDYKLHQSGDPFDIDDPAPMEEENLLSSLPHDEFDNEFDEAFDFNNGYDDINDAFGDDYFPNGADSPVVTSVGPSGARQGDNPEQKKMQVAEVHKELVYGYRNFLKESASNAHEQNLDAAQREMDRRSAEGEDMSEYSIDKKTYELVKKNKLKK